MSIENSSSAIHIPLVDHLEDHQNDTHLSRSLHRLEIFLRLFGFCQFSFLSFTLSWVSFLLLGVALPALIIHIFYCANCGKYQVSSFEFHILVFQSLVSTISLICISFNLRKYGVRRFLFVDRCHGYLVQFRDEYLHKIDGFLRLLAVWILPCLLLKTAREVACITYVHQHRHHSWWQSVTILIAMIISWTYSTVIYLSGCALFNLVCNLQVIHFENYGKLLEGDFDVSLCIKEHIRLTHHLSNISHRFRMFFILEILVVTASQFTALVQTTGNHSVINLINGGDFAVSSIVELAGIIICLHAAAKTTHRAQAVASVATRWHSLVTCAYNANNGGNSGEANAAGLLLPVSYSESDMDSVDYAAMPTNTQMTSNMPSYHKRQAFVMYLMANPGGFTVFGWTIDRGLINTIFFLEMSLVLFVLGKTITFTSK